MHLDWTLGSAGNNGDRAVLMPNKFAGVLIVWLIVTLAGSFCAYRIFQKLLPEGGVVSCNGCMRRNDDTECIGDIFLLSAGYGDWFAFFCF